MAGIITVIREALSARARIFAGRQVLSPQLDPLLQAVSLPRDDPRRFRGRANHPVIAASKIGSSRRTQLRIGDALFEGYPLPRDCQAIMQPVRGDDRRFTRSSRRIREAFDGFRADPRSCPDLDTRMRLRGKRRVRCCVNNARGNYYLG